MMHPIRLGRIAAEAEGVRLRAMVTRIATRIALAVIALVFLLGVLIFAHLAIWYALRVNADLPFLSATGILGGGDLIIAIVLGVIASRSTPSRIEAEALAVRRQAIQGLSTLPSMMGMVVPLLRLFTRTRRRA